MPDRSRDDNFRSTRPASDLQIRRAQALCAQSHALQTGLDAFLSTAPSYMQMEDYLKRLKAGIATSLASALIATFTAPPV